MDALIPLAKNIAIQLIKRRESVAVAESSTGGLVSAALLSIEGASAYYRGGSIIYTAFARQGFLAIPDPLPPPVERASTEPYALLLADSVRIRLEAVWGLSETGAAGPRGNRYGDKAGHSCLAVSGPGVSVVDTLETNSSDRLQNMRRFAVRSLELFDEALRQY